MESPKEITGTTSTDNESKKLDKVYHKRMWISTSIFLVILLFTFAFYQWRIPIFDWDSPIAADRWGNFGDFIGGTLSTIITFISIFFLYKAFIEQHLANVEARNVNSKIIIQNELIRNQEEKHIYWEYLQKFDNNFNTLLELYQKAILEYKDSDTESGKNSFNKMVSSFIIKTDFENQEKYTKRVHSAFLQFNDFITKHRTTINTHMRLLYQILKLLENNQLKENDIIPYIKIIRSQLTDEELILIRYNCLSKNGQKMQLLVFQFNILKHLPLMDLFEFKKYRKRLGVLQINYLNDTFIYWHKQICTLFSMASNNKFNTKKFPYGKRYLLIITLSNDKKNYSFILKKEPPSRGRNYEPLISILDLFDENDLENLLLDFNTEIFRHTHFRNFNRDKSFGITHLHNKDSKTYRIAVKNNLKPIIVSYFQIKHPISIN